MTAECVQGIGVQAAVLFGVICLTHHEFSLIRLWAIALIAVGGVVALAVVSACFRDHLTGYATVWWRRRQLSAAGVAYLPARRRASSPRGFLVRRLTDLVGRWRG